VFLVNSRHPLLCAPNPYLRTNWALFFRSYEGKLPSSFSTLLSSASAYSASPPVSVWGTVYTRELFPGTSSRPDQSNKVEQLTKSVTTRRPRNVDLVPIGYAFRPGLRGRLTLRRLTWRRNPWTFGERVSHPLYRYSCQHSHLWYLQDRSPFPFAGIHNALLPFILLWTRSFGAWLNPRYIFGARLLI